MGKKGGAIIGKGISGTVYYPALQCKNISETPSGNYVSKVSSKQSAENEFNNTAKLRMLPEAIEYAIFPEYMCTYNDKQNLLFSKFGGYSLQPFYEYVRKLSRSKNIKEVSEFDNSYFENVLSALRELQKNVKYLNENKIYHGDISSENMIYDEITNKIYLIDFEKGNSETDDSESIEDLIYDFEVYRKRILNR